MLVCSSAYEALLENACSLITTPQTPMYLQGQLKGNTPQYNRHVAIRISTWTFTFGTHISSQRSVGRSLSRSVEKYLEDLIEKLKKAHEIAAETVEGTQNNYASYYNLRSREKQFTVGDKVLVLLPSSTHKLMKTWIGPATIIEITRPYSAKVELDDGGIRELQFNKLRPFIARVGQVGLIFDQDSDFGDLSLCSNRYGCNIYGDVTDHISSDCQELEDVQ
ncbi:retrovirus-related Pol polyprotein from transposon opus [Trichonephila clavipes]|nr:retrovirus-related Pol polyprotein from transposon opus [Trichonephila clavipes]